MPRRQLLFVVVALALVVSLAHPVSSQVLYGTPFDNQSLLTFDPVTGAGTDVPGSTGNVPFRVSSLEFHPTSGVLYGSWNDAGSGHSFLVTIDTADGTATTIGQTVTGLDALSFECTAVAPIVEIPTLNTLGAGTASSSNGLSREAR